jgi:N-acetylmuramoyl-L-alanine amidase
MGIESVMIRVVSPSLALLTKPLDAEVDKGIVSDFSFISCPKAELKEKSNNNAIMASFESTLFFGFRKNFRILRKVISISRFIKNHVRIYQLLTLFLFLSICGLNDLKAQDAVKRKYKVILDAGHGGKDHGTRGKNVKEKDVVLAVTLRVGKYLESLADNIEVLYIRKKDEYSHPKERANFANEAEADLYVSIHANAMPPGYPGVSGTETFVMGTKNEGRNFEVAKRENSVILLEENYEEIYQGFDPNSPEVNIMFEIMQEAYQDNSIFLAQTVEEQFAKRAGRKSRGVKQSSLWVLWNTAMPSVLIEIGYLTNPKEERELSSDKVQDYIASAIFRSIRDYFEYIESIKD